MKLFPDFLTPVNEAVEQRVDLGPIREMLVKQLFWDRHNPATDNAVAEVCNKNRYKRVLAIRDTESSNCPITTLAVSLHVLLADR